MIARALYSTTRLHGQRFIYLYVPPWARMNTHTRGRDPARTPARAEEPKAGMEEWRMRMWSRALRDNGLRAHNHLARARGSKA